MKPLKRFHIPMNDIQLYAMKPIIKTLSVRVRDKHASVLNRMAFDTNQVWNPANADSADFSWVFIPEVGYMNFGTSAFKLMKDLKGIILDIFPFL